MKAGLPTGEGADSYEHPTADSPLRPDVGTQAQFKKKKPPATYRYDSSLSPSLEWDTNPVREQGEALLRRIQEASTLEEAKAAGAALAAIGRPFLNWTGKAERPAFDVPTMPLFVHERLSTQAILETLKGHRSDKQTDLFELFADPHRPIHDQILKAYEYRDRWVNRMILGDSLVVMNSLLQYEGLGGQVQMIYMDPPYGIQFGSNFQPFVRNRAVEHNDDEDLTREPEMVQAYRDTWELGRHSYLTYLRDRLSAAHRLLSATGSLFFQISDENIHHARELLDELFGAENFVVVICYRRLGSMIGSSMQSSAHYLLWYARDKAQMRYQKSFLRQRAGIGTGDHFTQVENRRTGERRPLASAERANPEALGPDWRPFQLVSAITGGYRPNTTIDFEFEGKIYNPGPNKCWRTTREGLLKLASLGRLVRAGETLRFKQYLDDFPLTEVGSIWDDTGRDPENLYVVQTPSNVVRRCMLMTTHPGDLVLDPTCGSGTTAYVAEQWGRRWITTDVSRVPLALARQRLLTATFDYFKLRDEKLGPSGGFVYEGRQNSRGEEVGGIVPHITLGSIANNEPPKEEVLVDRPEPVSGITRVTGPFAFEATIPSPGDMEVAAAPSGSGEGAEERANHVQRMIEVLRQSPVLRLDGNRTITLRNVRPPAKTLALSAEAIQGADEPVAFVFGPDSGAVSEALVFQAAKEANAKSYRHLYVVGFAIDPHARQLIRECEATAGIAATYVQATPDLLMGDLLKNMRSSQIFSVCGLPDVAVEPLEPERKGSPERWQVKLLGLDTFDPVSMDPDHLDAKDVPAWLLDTDYNDLCFHVSQAFFPRTGAWENLKRALRGRYEDSVWEHLAGDTSAPFEAGEHRKIAVKVIDKRGNELMVVKKIEEKKR